MQAGLQQQSLLEGRQAVGGCTAVLVAHGWPQACMCQQRHSACAHVVQQIVVVEMVNHVGMLGLGE
jgi:hypothetical protein